VTEPRKPTFGEALRHQRLTGKSPEDERWCARRLEREREKRAAAQQPRAAVAGELEGEVE